MREETAGRPGRPGLGGGQGEARPQETAHTMPNGRGTKRGTGRVATPEGGKSAKSVVTEIHVVQRYVPYRAEPEAHDSRVVSGDSRFRDRSDE